MSEAACYPYLDEEQQRAFNAKLSKVLNSMYVTGKAERLEVKEDEWKSAIQSFKQRFK